MPASQGRGDGGLALARRRGRDEHGRAIDWLIGQLNLPPKITQRLVPFAAHIIAASQRKAPSGPITAAAFSLFSNGYKLSPHGHTLGTIDWPKKIYPGHLKLKGLNISIIFFVK
jgi:hypothetical protein